MYQGYLSFSGTEIANAERSAAYIRHAMPSLFFNDIHAGADLYWASEGREGKYESPMVDDAPWFEPLNPDSWNFFGFYPIDITGGVDGTGTSTATELTDDGAVASVLRYGGRYINVHGMLAAGDQAGLEAGQSWLISALEGGACSQGGDGTLCYFTTAPIVNPTAPEYVSPEDCLAPYRRTMRRVQLLSGPTTLAEHRLSEGWLREVQFTVLAGVPFAFAEPQVVADNLELTAPVAEAIDAASTACTPTTVQPISDPNCPVVPNPPQPPSVPNICIEDPALWSRYQVPIPGEAVPTWAVGVPVVQLTVPGNTPVRQVRIRFYPNPFDYDLADLEPCDFCGEFIISYIPPRSTMTINGMEEVATISVQGGVERPANHLLYGSGNAPFEWPLLSCGTNYIMVADVAPAVVGFLNVSLSVIGRY